MGDKGKAIILVMKGALVRQTEKEMRERLTEADWLDAVITMPANMYASTHLGFELLVINKWKTAGVQREGLRGGYQQYRA